MAQAESTITVVTGPVVGYVDANSARILVEVDDTVVLTCQLIPDKQKSNVSSTDTQSPVQFSSTVEFRAGRPSVFTFTGLTQATYYQAVIGEVQPQPSSVSHMPCLAQSLSHKDLLFPGMLCVSHYHPVAVVRPPAPSRADLCGLVQNSLCNRFK